METTQTAWVEGRFYELARTKHTYPQSANRQHDWAFNFLSWAPKTLWIFWTLWTSRKLSYSLIWILKILTVWLLEKFSFASLSLGNQKEGEGRLQEIRKPIQTRTTQFPQHANFDASLQIGSATLIEPPFPSSPQQRRGLRTRQTYSPNFALFNDNSIRKPWFWLLLLKRIINHFLLVHHRCTYKSSLFSISRKLF